MACYGRLAALCVTLASVAAAAPGSVCQAARGTCAGDQQRASRESVLLQASRGRLAQSAARPTNVTSDCAGRLRLWDAEDAACIVARDGRALLIWVPYGSAPGWDLPGGARQDGEAACQTAERAACEETGLQVRAVSRLAFNVFQCEVLAGGICRNPVDEGFLQERWAPSSELGGLQYRGNSWGDKEGLLSRVLGRPPASSSLLLQADHMLAPSVGAVQRVTARGITSDCASRVGGGASNAACIVVRDGRALLVYVPYGSSPGWDLPGGWLHEGEAACQTAERETCEESGMQVRAVRRLSYVVFQCEIVQEHKCTNPVDEGFLQKRWASGEELSSLRFRGGTWGDKEGLLRQILGGSAAAAPAPPQAPALPPPAPPGQQQDFPAWTDACGCRMCQGEGFSSEAQQCRASRDSAPEELCRCLQRGATLGSPPVDACGCRACDGEGWSSTHRGCQRGSATSPQEGCQCQKDGRRSAFMQVVA